jgi:ADP-ribosylglycohydrolase
MTTYLKLESYLMWGVYSRTSIPFGFQGLQIHIIFAAPIKQYTDDSAMTKCLAESLIAQEKFDALDTAKR